MLLFAIGVIVFVLAHQRRVIKYQLNLQKIKEEQQHLLLHATIESEEKERQRIAGDLHDEVGASLSTIRLYLLQVAKKKTPEEIALVTGAAKEILDEVTDKVRQISHRLSPEMLMQFGLSEAIKNTTQKLNNTGSVRVTFYSSENQPRMQPEDELAVYRITQEIIGNLLKHAAATEMRVQLMHSGKNLVLSIEDNGKGFTQETFEKLKNSPGGLGLKNIQSRINILQGNISFKPLKSGNPGTLTTLTIPLERKMISHREEWDNILPVN